MYWWKGMAVQSILFAVRRRKRVSLPTLPTSIFERHRVRPKGRPYVVILFLSHCVPQSNFSRRKITLMCYADLPTK
jgi:hypothetical protein